MATVWVDDDKTKSDYNIKKKTWNCVGVVNPNGETSDTNVNVKTKINKKHMKLIYWRDEHVYVRIVLLVLFSFASSYSLIAHHIAWLKMSACLSHLIHAWSERALFDFELSIPSNFILPLSINLKQFLLPFYFHEVK